MICMVWSIIQEASVLAIALLIVRIKRLVNGMSIMIPWCQKYQNHRSLQMVLMFSSMKEEMLMSTMFIKHIQKRKRKSLLKELTF